MSRSQVVVPVIAFVATVAVVVPAGWQALEAEHVQDGPTSRPARRMLMVDGAQITVDVDHRVVGADGKVNVEIRGTAPTPREIELDLRFTSTGRSQSRGHRVPSPTVERARTQITLLATPDGGTPVTHSFEARKSDPKLAAGVYDLYELEVQPTVEDFKTQPNGAPNLVRVGVAGWSGNSLPVKMSSPKVTAEGTFEVDVTVTNNTPSPLALWVDFGAPAFVAGKSELSYELDPDYTIAPLGRFDDTPLAAGAERVFRYTLVPSRDRLRSFLVLANVRGLAVMQNMRATRAELERYATIRPTIGALDTVTFERPKK